MTREIRFAVLGGLAFLLLVVYVVCLAFEREGRLAHVPETFGVSTILYAREESWGVGPGGNETAIIVYELPAEVAAHVNSGRESYLKELNARAPSWPGHPYVSYPVWKATPMTTGDGWFGGGPGDIETSRGTVPRLESYLGRYGFGIEVDPAVRDEIHRTIRSAGSFYAEGRSGVLIVDPSHRKVYFVHAG